MPRAFLPFKSAPAKARTFDPPPYAATEDPSGATAPAATASELIHRRLSQCQLYSELGEEEALAGEASSPRPTMREDDLAIEGVLRCLLTGVDAEAAAAAAEEEEDEVGITCSFQHT